MPLPWIIAASALGAAATRFFDTDDKGSKPVEKEKPILQLEKDEEGAVSEASQALLLELGQRIETARVLQRMTQEKCANLAQVSRTALRNLEDGKDAKLSTLLAVSHAISLPLVTLCEGLQGPMEKKISEVMEHDKMAWFESPRIS